MRFLLILMMGLLLIACVEDPPVEVNTEAVLRGKFIPLDSVSKLELRKEVNSGLIEGVLDDLARIDSLINAGDQGDYTEEIIKLGEDLDSLEESGAELSSVISRLSAGNIQLDFLTALNSENQLTYDDYREIYGLPLNSRTGETTFLIGYGSYSGEASLSYSIESVYQERFVRLRGTGLSLVTHSFDSVRIQCLADTCTTDEILYTFYF